MKQKTSNIQMEKPENLLQTIQQVQPDPRLYAAIKQRIKYRQTEFTPWKLLKIAAALCGVLLCAEAYIYTTSSTKEADDLIALISINSNTIYDDSE